VGYRGGVHMLQRVDGLAYYNTPFANKLGERPFGERSPSCCAKYETVIPDVTT
jgi:hypothetical protein